MSGIFCAAMISAAETSPPVADDIRAAVRREHPTWSQRQVADAVSARLAAAGGAVLARATIESVLVTAVAAAWGYMLGRNVLWTAAGREASDELDAAVRGHLVRFVTEALGIPAGALRV